MQEFRNTVSTPIKFSFSNHQTTDIVNHLRNIKYDGGTCFGNMQIAKQLNTFGLVDFYLIFTDGFNTIGDDCPNTFEVPGFEFVGLKFQFIQSQVDQQLTLIFSKCGLIVQMD